MRTIFSVMLAVLISAALSQVTFAQMSPGGPGPGPGIQQGGGAGFAPEQFSDTKARMLKMIEGRKVRLDQEKACVEASKDMTELRKCRPERPMMGPGGPHGGGPGRQQSPMTTNPQ